MSPNATAETASSAQTRHRNLLFEMKDDAQKQDAALTFGELQQRLEAEGFNEDYYCIGSSWGRLHNGFALDATPQGFEFFYVERGCKSPIESFETEADACRYAYNFLANDKWSKSHMIGFFNAEEQAARCISWLQENGIEYLKDKIPYGGLNDPRYRVFVFGNDFKKVKDLRETNF